MEAAARTDIGKVRSSNEDSFGLCGDVDFFIVCDGMGGAAGGEIASRVSVGAAKEVMCADNAESEPAHMLAAAIATANKRVFQRAERTPSLRGMGTTLVSLLLREGRAWIAHVGDSRCYRFRSGELKRLTEDHSFVDEQVRAGQMTAEEAAVSPFRNIITRAVGTGEAVEPEIQEHASEPGDLYLLCSDGLTREVPEARLQELLREGNADEAETLCVRLIDEAKTSGGHDNITVIAVRLT